MTQRVLYIDEVSSQDRQNHAGSKARDDISSILSDMGFTRIELAYDDSNRASEGFVKSLLTHRKVARDWKRAFAALHDGDILIVQFPLDHHSLFAKRPFIEIRKRGVELVFLIHDLDFIRLGAEANASRMTRLRIRREELALLDLASVLIVHNERMKEQLVNSCGIDPAKVIPLGIFDYLIPEEALSSGAASSPRDPIVIAGNLNKEKAGFAYALPAGPEFNLYGPNYEDVEASHIHYRGQFAPEELPARLEGSFGLIWDGESAQTCAGAYGDYLRVNNPHKTSLYIASRLPVIIWSQAALAPFVTENGIGIAVDSLESLDEAFASLSDADYATMQENIQSLSRKLRTGYFTRQALSQALDIIAAR